MSERSADNSEPKPQSDKRVPEIDLNKQEEAALDRAWTKLDKQWAKEKQVDSQNTKSAN